MSKAIITEQHLHDIADAIIAKGGATAPMTPAQMPAAIAAIPTGEFVPKNPLVYEGTSYVFDTNEMKTWDYDALEMPNVTSASMAASSAAPDFNFSLVRVNLPRLVNHGNVRGFLNGLALLRELNIDSLEDIRLNTAFEYCRSLKKISAKRLKSISDAFIFDAAQSLEDLTLEALETITGSYDFRNCQALRHVTFPSFAGVIGEWCFGNCWNLKDMTLKSLTGIGGANTFSACGRLADITITEMTMAEVKAITNYAYLWNGADETHPRTVHCTDGDITYETRND